MTEAELVEAWGIFLGNSQTAMALYMSILSGYLIIAYLVGSKLSRLQAGIVSTLFLVASSFCTLVLTIWWQRALEFALEAKALNPDRMVNNSQFGVYVTGSIFCLGIFAALYFMWDMRRQKAK
jgi:hypothetical protein